MLWRCIAYWIACFVFFCVTILKADNRIIENSTTLEISIRSANYPAVDQNYYPWDFVAEPYRETIFSLKNIESNAVVGNVIWNLTYEDDHGVTRYAFSGRQGTELTYTFVNVGLLYSITVAEFEADGTELRSLAATVACKYVRRELRELTEFDRQRFLDGLELIHRLNLDEGRMKYGPKFANYEYFTTKHLGRMTLDGYSPYHGGQVFITSHFAFALELEQALQSIDPTIALPYWEYTIDSVAYGEEWQNRSPIFTDTWFGAYPPPGVTSPRFWTEGRWAYLPIPSDRNAPERNAYGRITDSINADSTPYVGRARAICGLPTRALLPGCKELLGVLSSPDLDQFHARVEYGYHGVLHSAIGGAWNCAYSLASVAEEHPSWIPILEGIALQSNTLWRGAALRKHLVVCPTEPCDPEDPVKNCVCGNPDLDATSDDDLPYEAAYNALDAASVIDALASNPWLRDYIHAEGYDPHHKDTTTLTLIFRTLSDAEGKDLIRFLVRYIAHPPCLSPFMTPLAATNDPIFGPSHSAWLRHWERRALHTNADSTWTNKSKSDWYGHAIDDALPFKGFLRSDTNDSRYYTNADLLQMMDPRNIELPYVHATLTVPHCETTEFI